MSTIVVGFHAIITITIWQVIPKEKKPNTTIFNIKNKNSTFISLQKTQKAFTFLETHTHDHQIHVSFPHFSKTNMKRVKNLKGSSPPISPWVTLSSPIVMVTYPNHIHKFPISGKIVGNYPF